MKRSTVATSTILGLVGTTLALLMSVQQSEAVPSFSRKYRTSCQTCHVAFPKLNAFGRAFRNRGYRFPTDDEVMTKQKQVSLGAPAYKKVWPHAVWPADVPGGSVASFIVESNYGVNNSEPVSNEFDGVDELGLVFGGTVGESFSFFGDIALFEGGQPGGIERLFFQYNHPGGFFNVRVGQIEPRAVPFSNHRRLTRISDYLVDVFPTIPAGNLFGFSPSQRGVEFYGSREGPGHKGGFNWSFGVVNGEPGGAEEALEGAGGEVGETLEALELFKSQLGGEFDSNSQKDFYGSAEYKIGGMGVLGGGPVQPENWRDNSVTLGAYFYRGFAPAIDELGTYFPSGNDFYRAGVKADIFIGDLNLLGALQLNSDDLQFGAQKEFRSTISMVQADYVLFPFLIPSVLFENVNPNFGPPFQRYTITTSVLMRANAKLLIELVKSSNTAPDLPLFDDQVRVGFNIAF